MAMFKRPGANRASAPQQPGAVPPAQPTEQMPPVQPGAMFGNPQEQGQQAPRRTFRSSLDNAPTTKRAAAEKDAKRLSTIAAVAVAVAIAGAGYGIVTGQQAASTAQHLNQETTQAVVATTDIAPGTAVAADMLKVENVPNSLVTTDAATDVASVAGRTATSNIPANAVVSTTQVSGEDSPTLAGVLDPGTVAATVTVDQETGVAGLIHQGDIVDVIGTTDSATGDTAQTLAAGVKVVALGDQLESYDSTYSAVTVQVTADQARAIAEADSVSLVLQNAADQSPAAAAAGIGM